MTEAETPRRARVLDQVRWSDVDAFGHVNNAAFVRFLDDARFATFPSMGVDRSGALTDALLVVGKHEIDYLAPLAFTTDPIVVELWVCRIGGASVDFGYEVVGPDGVIRLRALTRMVQLERQSLQVRPLDAETRTLFEGFLGSRPDLRGW